MVVVAEHVGEGSPDVYHLFYVLAVYVAVNKLIPVSYTHLDVYKRQEQSRRILQRNGPDMHGRFMREWVPMENRYFEEMCIREKCGFDISLNYR